jgi:DNA polymerase-4
MHGCEKEFMAPLPIYLMPGIDHKVVQKLIEFNVLIINDLGAIVPDALANALGSVAFDIYRFAHGIDNAPVREVTAPPPTLEEGVVLKAQTNDEQWIQRELFVLVNHAGTRLRRMGLAARRISLTVEYADCVQVSKACTVATPVSGELTLCQQCSNLFRAAYTRRIRLSSLKLRLTKLSSPYGQMDLFLDDESERKLMCAGEIRGGERMVRAGTAARDGIPESGAVIVPVVERQDYFNITVHPT